MKGKITMTVTIGLVCFILVAVMFMQFKTISHTDITALENMQETELRTEITSWKATYEEIVAKIEATELTIAEYRNKIENNQQASELLDKELSQANAILGKRDVSGPGIIITLTDTEDRAVTPEDLKSLINELKIAGAEAISINDERLIYSSYVSYINDIYVTVNGRRQLSPYVVKAIGNPTYLESGLSAKNVGYIDSRKLEGLDIVLQRQDSITIPKYNGNDLDFEYTK